MEEGARATLRLVTDPELDGVSGRFFNGQREARADEQAYDPDARRRLWELSERLTRVTRWIVDGMNVIGSRPDGWWRDRRGAMRRLVDELGRSRRERRARDGGARRRRPSSSTAAAWRCASPRAAGRDAADDDIAALVAADAEPGDLRVVTSDAALERPRARARRATWRAPAPSAGGSTRWRGG